MCKSIKIFVHVMVLNQFNIGRRTSLAFRSASMLSVLLVQCGSTQALQSSNKNCHEVLFEEHGKFCEKRTRHLFAVIFNS